MALNGTLVGGNESTTAEVALQSTIGTDYILADTPHSSLEFISVIRISAYIACAIYAYRFPPDCKYRFHSFGFILILEALLHFTQFLIEMLTDASSPGALCSMHKPFSLPLLGLIAFITLIFIVDAFRKNESLCITRQFTGFAWNLMIVGALIEIVGLCAVFTHPCTTSFESFKRGNGSEKAEFFTALTVAVAVRIPHSILLIASQNQIFLPLLVQVVLRALPIAFPFVITLILWN